jgi:lipoprotein-anchoring transpeptidase ErfK/SrfK
MFCGIKIWRLSVLAAIQLFFVLSPGNGFINNFSNVGEKSYLITEIEKAISLSTITKAYAKNSEASDKLVWSNSILNNTSVNMSKIILKKADKGTKVLDIQKRLDVLGYNLPLSGYYGDTTYNAVKDYQMKNSLEPTGSIDEALYKKLLKIPLLSLGPKKLNSNSKDVKNASSMEDFVNKNNFASYTKFLIWVNKASFNVAVFEGKKGEWKLIKSFPCTIGKSGKYETPTGIFHVGIKGKSFKSGNDSAKYYTQIKGNVLFHTILFDLKGQKIVDSRMKMKLSHGCIRLEIPNAVYIYDNIPQGTTIFINEGVVS